MSEAIHAEAGHMVTGPDGQRFWVRDSPSPDFSGDFTVYEERIDSAPWLSQLRMDAWLCASLIPPARSPLIPGVS